MQSCSSILLDIKSILFCIFTFADSFLLSFFRLIEQHVIGMACLRCAQRNSKALNTFMMSMSWWISKLFYFRTFRLNANISPIKLVAHVMQFVHKTNTIHLSIYFAAECTAAAAVIHDSYEWDTINKRTQKFIVASDLSHGLNRYSDANVQKQLSKRHLWDLKKKSGEKKNVPEKLSTWWGASFKECIWISGHTETS